MKYATFTVQYEKSKYLFIFKCFFQGIRGETGQKGNPGLPGYDGIKGSKVSKKIHVHQ